MEEENERYENSNGHYDEYEESKFFIKSHHLPFEQICEGDSSEEFFDKVYGS